MVLKATPEQIATAGNALNENAAAYHESVNVIYSEVDGLKSSWQGADNQQFISTIYGYRENIEALGQVISNYGQFLIKTAQSLEQLQADIAQQAGNL